jgi:hypothetical protein
MPGKEQEPRKCLLDTQQMSRTWWNPKEKTSHFKEAVFSGI